MSDSDQPVDSQSPPIWHRQDAVIKAFEDAWQSNRRPQIEDFLQDHGEHRVELLLELTHVDLERRLRSGEPVRIEEYFERFREFADHPGAVLELAAAEYRLRRAHEPDLGLDEYVRRFPGHVEALEDRLAVELRPSESFPSAETSPPPGGSKPSTDEGAAVAHPTGEKTIVLPALRGYQIQDELGAGGMGVVYRAWDPRAERAVAIKIVREEIARRPESKERFLREARALARIEHGNVVPIFHVDEENETPYFVMPLLRGESLEARLKRAPALSCQEAVTIGKHIAAGLAAIHEQNLVHRDIKPANIWLEERPHGSESKGQQKPEGGHPTSDPSPLTTTRPDRSPLSPIGVKILDLGLVRPVGSMDRLTQSGALVGTWGYMSPEQIDGHEPDCRADLFSLGCVLYRILTGRLPYGADSMMGVLQAMLQGRMIPVNKLNPQVPPALAALIERALAIDPKDRPSSAGELAGILEDIERGDPSYAPLARRTKRVLMILSLLGAAAALIVIAARLLPGNHGHAQDSASPVGETLSSDRSSEPARPRQVTPTELAATALLKTKCYECHGRNGRKAGFMNILDAGDLRNSNRVVPGRPDKSIIISRIMRANKPQDPTPRDYFHVLQKDEIQLLVDWITSGAALADDNSGGRREHEGNSNPTGIADEPNGSGSWDRARAEIAVMKKARPILDYLRKRKARYVGLLRGTVAFSGQLPGHASDLLKRDLPHLLENSLIWKYESKADQVILLRDANEIAAELDPGAGYLSDEKKRQRLFEKRYAPVWGATERVAADGFLVCDVTYIGTDRAKLAIEFITPKAMREPVTIISFSPVDWAPPPPVSLK